MEKIRNITDDIEKEFSSFFNMSLFWEVLVAETVLLVMAFIFLPDRCKFSTSILMPAISIAIAISRLSKVWSNYWTLTDEKGKVVVEKDEDGEDVEYFIVKDEYRHDTTIGASEIKSIIITLLKASFSIIFAAFSVFLLIITVLF